MSCRRAYLPNPTSERGWISAAHPSNIICQSLHRAGTERGINQLKHTPLVRETMGSIIGAVPFVALSGEHVCTTKRNSIPMPTIVKIACAAWHHTGRVAELKQKTQVLIYNMPGTMEGSTKSSDPTHMSQHLVQIRAWCPSHSITFRLSKYAGKCQQ